MKLAGLQRSPAMNYARASGRETRKVEVGSQAAEQLKVQYGV